MKTYQLTEGNRDVSFYKQKLRELSSISIRRSSKFNLLTLYGALQCMQGVSFSKRLGIYVMTQYGPVASFIDVFEKQRNGQKLSPFDFLNININNAAFYVSRALDVEGKNMVVITKDNHLNRGIDLAKLDMQLGIIDDALVGLVDEAVERAEGTFPDISHWVYFSHKETDVSID
ncbi:MAG: hypothetical protein CSA19_00705 [Deltaproteobacteria bacterium]|nr:MAG: hypothetical protein CSA19_00705 [Deltaproteobacteria bacterium]